MYLVKKNDLYLDRIEDEHSSWYNTFSINTIIKEAGEEKEIVIAHIYWNEFQKTPIISTERDNLQTYIVLYNQYQDFIYLVDEAYFMLELEHKEER